MRKKFQIIFLLLFLPGILLTSNAVAAENISVLKVDTFVMEKGSENYSVSLKVFVKNNGETDEVTVNVVAVDINGFELENQTVSGLVKQGKTRVLVSVVKIPKIVFEEIVRWEWKR